GGWGRTNGAQRNTVKRAGTSLVTRISRVLVTQASIFGKGSRRLFVPPVLRAQQQSGPHREEGRGHQGIDDSRPATAGVDHDNFVKDVDYPEQYQATSRHS